MGSPQQFMDIVAELQARLVAGDMAGYRALVSALIAAGRAWPYDAPILVTGMTYTSRTGSKYYAVPGSAVFLVDTLRGMVQLTAPNSETIAFAAGVFGTGTAPPSMTDRMVIKAFNTQIAGLTTNQGSEPPLIDVTSGNPTIGDYYPFFNEPRKMTAPRVLLATTQVTLSLNFLSVDTAVVGAATNYGVTLSGLLVTG